MIKGGRNEGNRWKKREKGGRASRSKVKEEEELRERKEGREALQVEGEKKREVGERGRKGEKEGEKEGKKKMWVEEE